MQDYRENCGIKIDKRSDFDGILQKARNKKACLLTGSSAILRNNVSSETEADLLKTVRQFGPDGLYLVDPLVNLSRG